MKKLITILFIIACVSTDVMPAFAVNVGTYKTETEYGLLDGFKINWKRKDKTQPFIEPREESSQKDKMKDYDSYRQSEYERTKYMYEGKAIL